MTLNIKQKIAIQPGSAADEATTRGQLDTGVAEAKNRSTHIGTQTVSTISDFDAAVNTLVQAVVGAAPGALDTLQELAAALGDDPNYAATVTGLLDALDARLDSLEAGQSGGSSVRSGSALIGDGAASTYNVVHNWALADKNKVLIQVIEVASGDTVLTGATRTSENAISVDFGSYIPSAGQYRVLYQEIV